MDTKQSKWRQWLRKHRWILAAGALGFTLLVLLALGSIRRFRAETPIASIEPDAKLPDEGGTKEQLLKQPTRLERYRQEMEGVKREHAKRRHSMETIVAMDFGSMSRDPADPERQADSTEISRFEEKSSKAKILRNDDRTEKIVLPPEAPRPVKAQRLLKPTAARQQAVQPDPFYTVRAVPAVVSMQQQELYRAVVHGDQELQPQATLLLRLLEDMQVGEHHFPRNSLLYGKLSGTGGGRLKLRILRVGAVPVRMHVYDQDYQEGIFYRQEEPLPAALSESRDDAFNQLLHAVPYGGVAGGLAGLGRSFLRKNRKEESHFLADGYPLYVVQEH